jgi:flavodoxin
MKTLVIYDSQYGNTEQIAKAIGGGIGGEVKVVKVGEANVDELATYDLIAIGSPTQGGRYTMAMKAFLEKIPEGVLKNKSVAAFDTRVKSTWVKLFGFAAGKIADELKKKDANLIVTAEPFYVKSTKGPLLEGELERAAAWGAKLAAAKKSSADDNAGRLDRP